MIRVYVETYNKYKYLLYNLVSRDFKVKYRRSVLGVAWSMLSPIIMMLILSAVFSRVFRFEVQNYPYPIYIVMGQTMYGFFNEATTSANYSIVESAQLIKKIYIPKYLFPIEKVLFAFINMLFSMIAILIMLIIFGCPFSWMMLLFPIPLLELLLFTLGFGLIVSALCVFFRDLKHLYTIITMAWFYITPIIYPIETVEESWIRYVVYINPLTWYIEYFRTLILYNPADGTVPGLQINIICLAWAIGTFAFGMLLFRKTQDRFILHI